MPGHAPKPLGHEPKRVGQFLIGPLPQRLSVGAIRKKYDVSPKTAANVRAAVCEIVLPKTLVFGSKTYTGPVSAAYSFRPRKKSVSPKRRRRSTKKTKSSPKALRRAKKSAPRKTQSRRRKGTRGK